MNAERCLLAGEALGLGYVALEKAAQYAKDRVVFGRPIGMNQGIQHPLAHAYMNLEAAKLATYHAAKLYDASKTDKSVTPHSVGVACNSAKYLAAEASFAACERAVRQLPFRSDGQSRLTWKQGPIPRRHGVCAGVSCRAILSGVSSPTDCTGQQSKMACIDYNVEAGQLT